MLSILEKECRFFFFFLDEIRPDYVVMHETFFQSDEIFYKICKARNIICMSKSDIKFRGDLIAVHIMSEGKRFIS